MFQVVVIIMNYFEGNEPGKRLGRWWDGKRRCIKRPYHVWHTVFPLPLRVVGLIPATLVVVGLPRSK